jgi:hypothetical protein
MKKFVVLSFGLLLSACNQTTQQASLDSPAVATAAAPAKPAEEMKDLPPIYNPLVDMHKKSPTKFAKDHAECRKQAEPQEKVARAAMAQQQTGAALQMAGSLVSMIPSSNFRQASNVANASALMQDVGATTQGNAAVAGASATDDYALVINTCLTHRGYTILR